MLFQPTNICPDCRGQLGNGTVDAEKPLTVRWQVNGNSAMTAFQIVIYQNDAESTQVFDTGKRTDGCPFYGTRWDGQTPFFTYTIQQAGLENGNEYKLVITQWWGEADADAVTQTSASAFVTRAAPCLTLREVPSPMTARVYTFCADYMQQQADALNWVRWQIAYAGQEQAPFYDTQNIYGTAQLQLTYDGFFTGNSYAVRCSVQTASGVEADTGWREFSVSYATGVLRGYLRAAPVAGGARLTWEKIVYIRAEADGAYEVADGEASVPAGTTITWDRVNGEAMAFDAPWSVVWSGRTVAADPEYRYSAAQDALLFGVTTDEGVWTLEYSRREQRFFASWNGTEIGGIGELAYPGRYSAVLTPEAIYLRAECSTFVDGLFPGQGRYPDAALYPMADGARPYVKLATAQFSLPQGAITGIRVGGAQVCDYIQVLRGSAPEDVIRNIHTHGGDAAPFDPETMYFGADFAFGAGGGNLDSLSSDAIVGVSLYRRQGETGTLQHVADLPLAQNSIVDYSLASQQGPYSWYLFAIGETTNIAQSVESNAVNPCFWDWTILVCEEKNGHYEMEAEYRFGKNLSSGAISNNNTPAVLQNFTRYPAVQPAPGNYMSGTLTSLIGVIDYTDGNGYSDTLQQRDAVQALSTTGKTLFLKNRKGDFFRIRTAGAITMTTMDGSREQAQTAAIPWVQVGSGDGVSIVGAL